MGKKLCFRSQNVRWILCDEKENNWVQRYNILSQIDLRINLNQTQESGIIDCIGQTIHLIQSIQIVLSYCGLFIYLLMYLYSTIKKLTLLTV